MRNVYPAYILCIISYYVLVAAGSICNCSVVSKLPAMPAYLFLIVMTEGYSTNLNGGPGINLYKKGDLAYIIFKKFYSPIHLLFLTRKTESIRSNSGQPLPPVQLNGAYN